MTIFTRSQAKRRRHDQKESNQEDATIGFVTINDSSGADDPGLVDRSITNNNESDMSSIPLSAYCWKKRIIDKTIICKALFGIDNKLVRVCVPKGYGKSYNLLVIREFFNVLTRHDMPELIKTPYGISTSISNKYVLNPTKARSTRTERLANTLLRQELPAFFKEHFCQYPVILIRFDKRSQLLISLFMDLLDLLVDVYERRYIILIDNYDIPLVSISSEPHANSARKFYIEFLCRMLANNINLEKALLVGTYVLPLSAENNRTLLENVLTISHAAQQCVSVFDVGNSLITSYEAVLENLFGIRKTDATDYIKNLTLYYPKIGNLLDDVVKKALQYFGGHRAGFYEVSFITNQLKGMDWKSDFMKTDVTLWRDGKIPLIDNDIRLIALKYHIEMALLSSRLTCGYDFKQHSCYIWPSLEAAQQAGHNIKDRTCNFVLAPFSVFDYSGTKVDLDNFVTLLLHMGYLTIGNGNTLQIPNEYSRRQWETIRRLSIFESRDRIKQDTERHRLIESLFSKDIDLLCQEFYYVLTQAFGQNDMYSDQTRLELACRYLVGKMCPPNHYVNHNENLKYIQELVLVFGFVHITEEDLKDSKMPPTQLASNALAMLNDGGFIQQASKNEYQPVTNDQQYFAKWLATFINIDALALNH
ncbi:hypothetical protein H4S08_002215 [Coemansia sp. RSA 1365]|nr:hypothetical protein H4S08_002215 [Coemansia sp. RSA 1365]